MSKKIISIVGLGYIGLPTSILVSSAGYEVNGFDMNPSVIESLSNGRVHLTEPNLQQYFEKAIATKKLSFKNNIEPADIYFICVPTPLKKENNMLPSPDISFVEEAASSISSIIKEGDLVILESTSPIGTTEKLDLIFNGKNKPRKIKIAYCPERVLPGNIMNEITNNDRIIGGIDKDSQIAANDFYKTLVKGNILNTDSRTAEFCKLIENSYRDLNIAFSNEISMFCEENNINALESIEIANKHPRVNILNPGPGVGGHCIPIDPWFLVALDNENTSLIRHAREINEKKIMWCIEKIQREYESSNQSKVILLGMSYKPDSDDFRESPSIEIARELSERSVDVEIFDPNITDETFMGFNALSKETLLKEEGLFVTLVNHSSFREAPLIDHIMTKNVIDFCGLLKG